MNAVVTALFLITLPVSTLTSFAEEFQCGAPSDPRAVDCYRREVKDFLQSWVVAWSQGDAEAYLNHYDPVMSPKPEMTREEWEMERRQRVASAGDIVVTLELDSMGIAPDGSLDVIFVQSYESETYKDVVKKQLFLRREASQLKIQREVTVE